MKNKHFFLFKFILLLPFLFSCGSHNKLGSPSRPYYQKATDYFKSGNELEAVNFASQGVVLDPVYENSKEFLYKNYDNVMTKTDNELRKYENTADTGQAVRQLHIYRTLVEINNNISKMTFPLEHHKGKWKWSTKPIDYTKQAESSYTQAYKVFYDFGNKRLAECKNRNDVEDANSIFSKAYTRYTKENSDNRVQSGINIQNDLCNFGDKYKDSDKYPEAIMAAIAYIRSKPYSGDTLRGNQGYEYTRKRVSLLLVKEGKLLNKQTDLNSLLNAEQFYKDAIAWDNENSEAVKLKEKINEDITEAYYQQAKKMDMPGSTNYDEIKKAYSDAMIRIPGYKDCQARIYAVEVRQELVILEANIVKTQVEYDTVQYRAGKISDAANYAKDIMDKITYISDNLKKLDNTLHTTSLTMKPLNLIPYVNVVSMPIDKTCTIIRVPVKKSVQIITAVEKPLITPTKNAVEKIKLLVDLIMDKMNTVNTVLVKSRKTSSDLQTCIFKVKDEEALKSSKIAIIELNKGLVEATKLLSRFNANTNDVMRAANSILETQKYINPISSGIDAIKPALDEVSKITKEIDKVLDASFLGISARKALSLGGAAAEKAMDALKPLLNKMNVSLPEIPGLDSLEAELNRFKGRLEIVTDVKDKIQAEYDKYFNVEKIISDNLNMLVAKTGCGTGIPALDPNSLYRIKSAYSTKYWDINGSGSQADKDGANVQLWSLDNGKDRIIKFVPAGDNLYYIEFQNGGKVLDVQGGETKKGTNVQLWTKNNSDAQKFLLVSFPEKENIYCIVNPNSSKAIDASGGKTDVNGTNLQIWDYQKSNKAQQWEIMKVK